MAELANSRDSSVPERLLGNIVVFFFSVVYELNLVRVLLSGHGLLSLLVGNEGLDFIDIITFTICESQMVSLVSSSVGWSQQVRDDQVEELRHVDDIEKFVAISGVEPHPVSV